MEREIKFRAWDEKNKIMHNNFQFIKSSDENNDWIMFISDKQPLTDNLDSLKTSYYTKQFKIMQWTGIENIYEGDIVSLKENGANGIVKYDKDSFYVDCGNIFTRVSKLHKIKGNIYEI